MERDDFYKRLKELNLNKKDFAQISEIPYSTVNNWGTKGSTNKLIPVPNWVRPFLDYYEKAKKLEYVMEEICSKIKEVKIRL